MLPNPPKNTMADTQRYHVIVLFKGNEQKEHSCDSLEKAKVLIQYERDEESEQTPLYNTLWASYGSKFEWIVRDTKEGSVYTYNTQSRSLEPILNYFL